MDDDQVILNKEAAPESISVSLTRRLVVFSAIIITITVVAALGQKMMGGGEHSKINQLGRIQALKDLLPIVSSEVRLGDINHNEIARQQLLADIDRLQSHVRALDEDKGAVKQAFEQTVSYWNETSETNLKLNQADQQILSEFSTLKRTIAQEPPQAQRLQQVLALDNQLIDRQGVNTILMQLSENASLTVSQVIDRIKAVQAEKTELIQQVNRSREGQVYQGITAIENFGTALHSSELSIKQQLNTNSRNQSIIVWLSLALIVLTCITFWRQFKHQLSTLFEPYRNVINSARHIRHVNLRLEDQVRRKRSFISVVSYEARTLLGTITGSASQARQHAQNEVAIKHIEDVVGSGNHLEAILNDVMTMIDAESNQLVLDDRVFNFHYLLKTLKAQYTQLCEQKGIEFSLKADKCICKLYAGDINQLRRALDNLLLAAVRYTDKGQIELSIDVDAGTSTSAEQRINFTLTDTGVPVVELERATYFEPYERSFGSARGGEGYSIRSGLAALLIKRMGGAIQITSDSSKGLTLSFYVNLAMAAPGAEEVPLDEQRSATESSAVSVNTGVLNIMVVDDNETNAQMLQWMLEDMSHRVTLADNGAACLNLLEAHHFDLIFMDQYMPEMDGAEATAKIRARTDGKANVPIIGCTADGFQETQQLLMAAGQNDIIVKPVGVNDVLSVMQGLAQGKFKAPATGPADKLVD